MMLLRCLSILNITQKNIHSMGDNGPFQDAAEKIGRFLPAGAYTGFQYIAAQITTDGTCDPTQVNQLFYTVITIASIETFSGRRANGEST